LIIAEIAAQAHEIFGKPQDDRALFFTCEAAEAARRILQRL